MYSPKITEDLIPILYKKAKEVKKPMTIVVDELLRPLLVKDEALVSEAVRITSQSITSPDILYGMIKEQLTDYFKEHFLVCCLDVRNRVISIDTLSIGTLTASLVHPREVFELATKRHSASIIVAHNHPSGDISPSEEDIRITRRLVDAGKIMGIELIDHLIITSTNFKSLKDSGLI